jgi:hypothetical protein
MGMMRKAYIVLVGKLERKRLLGRLRRRWDDNIRKNLREIWWESVDWMHLSQNRYKRRALVTTLMNLWVL